jgi:hypothetical protein
MMVRRAQHCPTLQRQYFAFWGLATQERQVDKVAVPARCTLQRSLPRVAPVTEVLCLPRNPGDSSGAILPIDGYNAGS